MPSPARRGGSSRQAPVVAKTTGAALALRISLVAVAAIIDAYKPLGLRYTDVDYDVLKDGARATAQGGSPFQRATYRYSPIVAWPLLLDIKTGLPLAKLVFCVFDVLLGNAMGRLASHRGASSHVRLLWLFNPISIVLCTRGSWDAVSVYLVVKALLSKRSPVKAGLLLGLATHLRLYPVIYAAPFLYNFCFEARRRITWGRALAFCVAFASGLLAPTLYAYRAYGAVYVEEALLYHLRRADHRHSFSVFWLPIYLSRALRDESLSLLLKAAPFAAHFLLQAASLLALKHDMEACALAQTLLFVAANKVCTAQYFCWWLPLLIVVVDDWRRILKPLRNWVLSCGLWLGVAYGLEFVGLPVHMLLWGCSLLFFRANVDLLISAVSAPPEEKAPPQVRVSLIVEETDSWTDDGDTDEDVDDNDPGAASGWGMKL
jgi:phosphatidylinositol glycan class M